MKKKETSEKPEVIEQAVPALDALPTGVKLKMFYTKPGMGGMVCYVGECNRNYTTPNKASMVEVFLHYADGTHAVYNFRRENIKAFQPF